MKKIYRITVSGRGSESYIHKLDDNQGKSLFDLNVEDNECSNEEICEILNKNDIFDTDDIVLGVYNNPEHYYIEVKNDNNVLIWDSTTKHEFKDTQVEYEFGDDKILIVEDYVKGILFTYEIELEEDFDSDKLTPIITDIGERIEVITDLMYGDVDLSFFKDYGDYWSKGISYYLN